MKQIEKTNWYVSDNDVSISLMRFHAKYSIKKDDEHLVHLTVTDKDMKKAVCKFDTIEEAVSFTENVVDNCMCLKDIYDAYKKMYLFQKENKGVLGTKLFMSSDDIEGAIIAYHSRNQNFRVSSYHKLELDEEYNPIVRFYSTELFKYDGKNHFQNHEIPECELKQIINSYLNKYDYEIGDFKYIGGVHRPGVYVEEYTPYFEGIELNLKKKDKALVKKK